MNYKAQSERTDENERLTPFFTSKEAEEVWREAVKQAQPPRKASNYNSTQVKGWRERAKLQAKQAQPPEQGGPDLRTDHTFDLENDTNTIESTPESEPNMDFDPPYRFEISDLRRKIYELTDELARYALKLAETHNHADKLAEALRDCIYALRSCDRLVQEAAIEASENDLAEWERGSNETV